MRYSAACLLAMLTLSGLAHAETGELQPVRIANPVNGHIHPAACVTKCGTIVVTYGRINHNDLRITRSTDGGQTWTPATPFGPTLNKTYYPGSLTTLADGSLVHAWNRWSSETKSKKSLDRCSTPSRTTTA